MAAMLQELAGAYSYLVSEEDAARVRSTALYYGYSAQSTNMSPTSPPAKTRPKQPARSSATSPGIETPPLVSEEEFAEVEAPPTPTAPSPKAFPKSEAPVIYDIGLIHDYLQGSDAEEEATIAPPSTAAAQQPPRPERKSFPRPEQPVSYDCDLILAYLRPSLPPSVERPAKDSAQARFNRMVVEQYLREEEKEAADTTKLLNHLDSIMDFIRSLGIKHMELDQELVALSEEAAQQAEASPKPRKAENTTVSQENTITEEEAPNDTQRKTLWMLFLLPFVIVSVVLYYELKPQRPS